MFFVLSKVLQFLVYPLSAGFLALLGIVIFYHRPWGRRALLVVLLLFYALSIPYTADRFMHWLEVPRVPIETLRPPYAAVIVLSGMLQRS